MSCASANILLAHINGKKQLTDFTTEELKLLPLEYLIKNANPIELLNIWGKLPMDYKDHFYLQIKLPCFVTLQSSGMENPF